MNTMTTEKLWSLAFSCQPSLKNRSLLQLLVIPQSDFGIWTQGVCKNVIAYLNISGYFSTNEDAKFANIGTMCSWIIDEDNFHGK